MEYLLSKLLSVEAFALIFILVVLKKSIIFVPQNRAWLI